jgi:Uma2 family endonuclease
MLQDAAVWLDERPYKEIYDGRVHPKVSPKLAHTILQVEIGALLRPWTSGRGSLGSELRVYLDDGTTLVPDVAYIAHERFTGCTEQQWQQPPFAPDLTIEIRSPGDRERNVRRKMELYLKYGATVVLDVDPAKRSVRVTTKDAEAVLGKGDVFEHPAFPGLRLSVDEIFAPLDDRPLLS